MNATTAGNATETLSFATVIGTSYNLRIVRVGGTNSVQGNLCVRAGGDDCADAISITAASNSTCTTTSATTVGATQSATGCDGVADDDVWFSFVATAVSHQVTVTPGTLQNPVFEIFSGNIGLTLSGR